jgi:prolyl-tRNA editing enzyme YbaK/EbsC (Cys-tRNA(Pro) deacylase)
MNVMDRIATLHPNARRFQDYLLSRGFDLSVFELAASTRTAADAAVALGCAVGRIAKSLVFKNRADDKPVLVICSGSNRVDLKKVKEHTGLVLKRADADYVKAHTGFSIGGVPPAGHRQQITTLLDEDLQSYDSFWAATGTPHGLFELTPEQLESMTGGSWLSVST